MWLAGTLINKPGVVEYEFSILGRHSGEVNGLV